MPTKRQSLKREANQNRPALAFCPSGQRPACQLYFLFPYPYFYQFAVNWQTRTVQHFVQCRNPKLYTLTAHCSRILRTCFDAADRFAVRLKVKGLDDFYCCVHGMYFNEVPPSHLCRGVWSGLQANAVLPIIFCIGRVLELSYALKKLSENQPISPVSQLTSSS